MTAHHLTTRPVSHRGDPLVTVDICDEPVSGADAERLVVTPRCGAVVTFTGVVRDHTVEPDGSVHEGVRAIEYDVYRRHALPRLREIAERAGSRWVDVQAIALIHRAGVVPLGGASVVVSVGAGHRVAAFHAAQFCIDVVKRTAPIWKHEIGDVGGRWVDTAVLIEDVADAAGSWRPAPDPTGIS
ncbi:MAG: molybdenum cofactor biosynthesis protein MoaE [Gordonia paraffinivorans]